MNIGFVGLGKLGLPVSVCIAQHGYRVYACDKDPNLIKRYKKFQTGLYEPDIDEKLKSVSAVYHLTSLSEVVQKCDLIFVAVQTPHPPELDGSVRFNHVRKDFDYTHLTKALKEIAAHIQKCDTHKTMVIISTVLPGTVRNVLYPAMQDFTCKEFSLLYNPFFIAMGTVIKDFEKPEFVLVGANNDSSAVSKLRDFYADMNEADLFTMTWEEAECTKMFYNTFIGAKIIIANTIMQMCHKLGANCDVVSGALSFARDRIISPKYLKGGMGDGGPCHPRDNMALAYLSDKLSLDYNVFDFLMTVRESQVEWLADLICQYDLPKIILGQTFKPHTNQTAGSPSILLKNILEERGECPTIYDPVTCPDTDITKQAVFIIGTAWPEFRDFKFPKGSVVIDPWGLVKERKGIELIRVGRC